MDITQLIVDDHAEQRRLFAVIDQLGPDEAGALRAIWSRLQALLDTHAEAEERFAQATVTRLERRAVDEMRGRDAQRLRPPGKSLFTGWKLQFEGF